MSIPGLFFDMKGGQHTLEGIEQSLNKSMERYGINPDTDHKDQEHHSDADNRYTDSMDCVSAREESRTEVHRSGTGPANRKLAEEAAGYG